MKYILLGSITSFILACQSLIAHDVKLVNKSVHSAAIVYYSGDKSASEIVQPGTTATLEAPNESEGILMVKLYTVDPTTQKPAKVISEAHLNTNYFDKVTEIEIDDQPNSRMFIYQGYGEI